MFAFNRSRKVESSGFLKLYRRATNKVRSTLSASTLSEQDNRRMEDERLTHVEAQSSVLCHSVITLQSRASAVSHLSNPDRKSKPTWGPQKRTTCLIGQSELCICAELATRLKFWRSLKICQFFLCLNIKAVLLLLLFFGILWTGRWWVCLCFWERINIHVCLLKPDIEKHTQIITQTFSQQT